MRRLICGMAYKIRHPRDESAVFDLSASYVLSVGKRAFVARPETWRFQAPRPDGFVAERYGASEVRGMFGGVADARQHAYSEACERAIGEVLTVNLCAVLDGLRHDGSLSVLILGPALPKVVGRFASLRPPAGVTISWICPEPFPQWIADRANDVCLVPTYLPHSPGPGGRVPWDEEALVVGEKLDHDAAIAQYLQLWDPVSLPMPVEYVWIRLTLDGQSARMPRELAMAAGVVDNKVGGRYEDGDNEWVPLPVSILPQDRYAAVPAKEDPERPGWNIEWREPL